MRAGLEPLRSLRATRSFAEVEVSDEELELILDTARWTGSARNRQPWRFRIVREPEPRVELSGCGAYAGHLRNAPLVVLLGLDTSWADAEFDGGRVAQTIMLAAHALGLGSCPATFFPEHNIERATALSGWRPPWRVRTAIALGHPAAHPSGTSAILTGRLSVAELCADGSRSPGADRR